MFGELSEVTSHGDESFSDLFFDSGYFNSPPGNSGIPSPPVRNESEDRPEGSTTNDGWCNYVLDLDDSDVDGLDGKCELVSPRATQSCIEEALDKDILPHVPTDGQTTEPAQYAAFFLTHTFC